MDELFPYKSLKIRRRQGGLHSSLWWSLPRDTPVGAIHSPKISGNFGPKLNGSVRSNRKRFEKTGPPFEVVLFSRSDRSEFWLNGSRPIAVVYELMKRTHWQRNCSPIGPNNTKHFLWPIRSRHPLQFLQIVRWESVPRGSFARFSRPDWLLLGLRGWNGVWFVH